MTSLFKSGEFVLGSIKPLEKLYNIDVLIQSFAQLLPKYPELRLLIAGQGSVENELKALTEKMNLSQQVVFTGRIPFSEVSNYYNMIDVLVNISEYESFGVSVIEAMSCEKPVVVTNVGGLKDIVNEEALGFKVEVRNVEQTVFAIEELITNKSLYDQIALKSRQHVIDNYAWKNNLEQMLKIYDQLLIKTEVS